MLLCCPMDLLHNDSSTFIPLLECPLDLRRMTAESGLNFISSNAEAQRALMHLHPCKLMRLEQGYRASPMPAAETGAHSDPAAPSTASGSLTLATPDNAASQQKQSVKQDPYRLRQRAPDPSTYDHIRRGQVGFDSLPTHGPCHPLTAPIL